MNYRGTPASPGLSEAGRGGDDSSRADRLRQAPSNPIAAPPAQRARTLLTSAVRCSSKLQETFEDFNTQWERGEPARMSSAAHTAHGLQNAARTRVCVHTCACAGGPGAVFFSDQSAPQEERAPRDKGKEGRSTPSLPGRGRGDVRSRPARGGPGSRRPGGTGQREHLPQGVLGAISG